MALSISIHLAYRSLAKLAAAAQTTRRLAESKLKAALKGGYSLFAAAILKLKTLKWRLSEEAAG